MRKPDAGRQIPLRRKPPIEHQPQIDIGIDLRTDHRVERIGLLVVPLPSERKAEIPFVVQREPLRQRRDARMLEDIESDRRTDLGAVEKSVVSYADTLIREGVIPAETGVAAELERIFQMDGQRLPERVPLGIGPLEKTACPKERSRTDIEADLVDEFTGALQAVRRHRNRLRHGLTASRDGQHHTDQSDQNRCHRRRDNTHMFAIDRAVI